jgi:putative redox protein
MISVISFKEILMSDVVIVAENGQGRYQQEIRTGRHRLLADEPLSVGGADAGPAPFDFLMAGLGACTSMTLRMYAERKELPLTGIRVALSHHKIDIDGKPHDQIRREISLEGELCAEQRRRLLEIAGKCPVHRALSSSMILECTLTE